MERKIEAHALNIFRSHLAPIAKFMDDPDVQEIMLNAPNDVWIERSGQMTRMEGLDISDVNLRTAIKALAGANSKEVHPVLDCRMPGFRIAAAMTPVGIRGNAICIRKHGRTVRFLDDYAEATLQRGKVEKFEHGNPDFCRPHDDEIAKGGKGLMDYIRWLVKTEKNIMIAGSTGSGKTTFLNALLREVPESQRVLTIEDTAELKIVTPNHVSFETSDEHGVSIRSLVRLSLRFRPDRIVVGEVRGAESYDLLDALNTGHSGGACSLHADSPLLALGRLESMVRMNTDAANLPLGALREQIASTFHAVIFCSRKGNRRGPEKVMEVLGVEDGGYKVKTVFDLFG